MCPADECRPVTAGDDLYEADFHAWSAVQAEALRRLAGLGGNTGIDWDNLVEEVESLGRSERHAVESLWGQAMVHLIKLYLDPENTAAEHWRHEIAVFLTTAQRRYSPSMRQSLDAERNPLWHAALRVMRAGRHVPPALEHLPTDCPFTLADLLSEQILPDTLVARLEPQP